MKKIVWLKDVYPGDKLAQDIYSNSGTLLIARGTTINQAIISRLARESITTVQVTTDDPNRPEAAPADGHGTALAIPTPSMTLGGNPVIKKNIDSARHIAEEVTRGRPIPVDIAQGIVREISEQIIENKNIYIDLMGLRSKDNYTYEHSIGVCVIATTFFRSSALTREELNEVSMAALLHDIGKARIADEILKKPGPLNDREFEIIKQHPVLGYRIIKEDLKHHDIAHAALQHHEREDGSGYPLGLVSGGIHRYAKIINIADTFDAIVSERVYQEKRTPIKAFEEISRSIGKFDSSIYSSFINQFSQFYVGSPVTLNTGHKGSIVRIDAEYPGQPLIKVGESIIDLKKIQGVFITEMMIRKGNIEWSTS
ncbi:MAG: HD-GYP domain-containing protein [Firmicutes bacterium]|nr:HD-GYP domain-containing protein [Bacillota bacterium]